MNTTTQQNKNQNELGALWKKKSKTGMSFLSGYVKVDDLGLEKEIKVVVFANGKKTNEKAPDYRIYVSKPMETTSVNQSISEKSLKEKTVKKIEQEDDDSIL